jgi:membrane-associated phospholipid phosphatase
MPVLVAVSRMYRGEHHPTDILGSLLFSALWLTAVTLLIRPTPPVPRCAPGKRGPGDRRGSRSHPHAQLGRKTA